MRMVFDHAHEYPSQRAVVCSVADKLGPRGDGAGLATSGRLERVVVGVEPARENVFDRGGRTDEPRCFGESVFDRSSSVDDVVP